MIEKMNDQSSSLAKMIANLRSISDSLTDWDNPINAKAEIGVVIQRLIDMEAESIRHKAIEQTADRACAENTRMREWLEKIIEHSEIISPTGYKMTGFYAMAMRGLGREGEQ